MAKLTLTDLTNLSNEASAVATINANWLLIETALENTLSLDGTLPNSLTASLDFNSYNLLNCGACSVTTLTVNGTQVQPLTGITDAALLSAANYFTGLSTFDKYRQVVRTLGPTESNVDVTVGSYFYKLIGGATTFTFTSPPTGYLYSFTLELEDAGTNITWPVEVQWQDGVAPILTTTGIDILTFVTRDGGTTWYGFPSGLNMS